MWHPRFKVPGVWGTGATGRRVLTTFQAQFLIWPELGCLESEEEPTGSGPMWTPSLSPPASEYSSSVQGHSAEASKRPGQLRNRGWESWGKWYLPARSLSTTPCLPPMLHFLLPIPCDPFPDPFPPLDTPAVQIRSSTLAISSLIPFPMLLVSTVACVIL